MVNVRFLYCSYTCQSAQRSTYEGCRLRRSPGLSSSCIAKWTGVRSSPFWTKQGKPGARYVVFRCFDAMNAGVTGKVAYYESIDMLDARHPQTTWLLA